MDRTVRTARGRQLVTLAWVAGPACLAFPRNQLPDLRLSRRLGRG
jgi:hypothetical protein